jgi:hypothetical protein
MMASLLLSIRMVAGTCVLSTLSAVTQARINYLYNQAFVNHLLRPPSDVALHTTVVVTTRVVSEMALFALVFCALALIPALGLRRTK